MSDARDGILGRLRSRLGRSEGGSVELPPELRHAGPRPAIGGDLVGRFVERARAASADVTFVEREGAPAVVARALAAEGRPPQLVVGGDPDLRRLPWSEAGLRVVFGERPTTAAATRALAALAETGTLVLASGPDNPMLLNFLPDHHFVLLDAADIVAHQEEAWERLREPGLPRSLTFVTGPSRTGDIEFTLQLGAHGPRHLHVLLVGG